MARIVKTPFVLNLPTGEKKNFAVGDKVEGDEEKHWYAEAHSEEVVEETAAEKKAREKAEKEAAKAAEEQAAAEKKAAEEAEALANANK